MGLDSYFGYVIYENGKHVFHIADELDWPDVKLCGGMFSGHGNGSFRGKVYNDLVENITGQSLYDENLDVGLVASELRAYVNSCRDTCPNQIIDERWEIEFQELVDLTLVFEFANAHNLKYDCWY